MASKRLLKACLTSATIFTAGDILSQKFVEARPVVDLQRTRNFCLLGAAIHAPWFHFTMPWLAQQVSRFSLAKSQYGVVRGLFTSSIAQFTIFPPYLLFFLTGLSLLNREEALARVKARFVPLWTTACAFWPIANIVTFGFMPPHLRILWINIAGLFWNTFLAYYNRFAPATASHTVAKVRSEDADSIVSLKK